jgi:hypothetical protein
MKPNPPNRTEKFPSPPSRIGKGAGGLGFQAGGISYRPYGRSAMRPEHQMTKLSVTMWMNVPSFYQQGMYRELASIDSGRDSGLNP